MSENIDKTISDKTGFITKASAQYCNMFPLRTAIQAIPSLGSPLDTMLAGLGAKYQYQRLEGFVSDLQDKFKKLEQINNISNMKPSEELFDLMMQIFDQVIKTRSQEKRKRFANLIANQVVSNGMWDEAETATRLLADLTDLHIRLIEIALNAPICDGVFEGLRIVTLKDFEIKDTKKAPAIPPTNISVYFSELSVAVLQMICSELVANGLFYDESIGRWGGPKAMTYLRATNLAKWLINWVCEPKAKLEDNNE